MAPRRPPDILRKSHAHSEGKERARSKRVLLDELSDAERADAQGRALLVDLDGVLYVGDRAIPGAADAIAWLRAEAVPHLFVTNTTSKSRADVATKLKRIGIETREQDILTPSVAATAWLRARGLERIALFVPESARREFDAFERLTDDSLGAAPQAVVIGDYGENWDFAQLNRAFRWLMAESSPPLIALGMTRYWRAPDGLRLDTGPFVAALAQASGQKPVVLGKPAPAFFATALKQLAVTAESAWMIGDDIRADVEAAQRAGLKGILVKTGKFRAADLDLGIAPDLLLASIAELPQRWAHADLHTPPVSR